MLQLRTLILDFSALSHIDLAGATTLGNLITEYCEIDIPLYITGCSGEYNRDQGSEVYFMEQI